MRRPTGGGPGGYQQPQRESEQHRDGACAQRREGGPDEHTRDRGSGGVVSCVAGVSVSLGRWLSGAAGGGITSVRCGDAVEGRGAAVGAACGQTDSRAWTALSDYGAALGLAFQVVDDILDVTQTTEKLGKSAGKDLASEKSTYPALLGLEASREEAHRLTNEAMSALEIFGERALRLRQMAEYLLARDY